MGTEEKKEKKKKKDKKKDKHKKEKDDKKKRKKKDEDSNEQPKSKPESIPQEQTNIPLLQQPFLFSSNFVIPNVNSSKLDEFISKISELQFFVNSQLIPKRQQLVSQVCYK